MSFQIRKLDELIRPTLKNGQTFLSSECKKLLPPGENYGSVMLQVQVRVLSKDGEIDLIHCVGKTCPPSDLLWEFFNTKVTFKKEISVYTTIVPTLNQFAQEKGFDRLKDLFARCLGARISLDPISEVVDKDAVLLLENLKVQGYDIGDRFVGFDLYCAKFLLNDLATLHATTIAYKYAKPEDFNTKIRPHLKREFSFSLAELSITQTVKSIQEVLGRNPQCTPLLSKIEEAVNKLLSYSMESPLKERELFATFTHNDYWVNNTMLKLENGKPVSNKLVDFQIIEYRSLAHDVIFFLYSSVELSVLENYLDELIKYYYEQFIANLKKMGCDVDRFSFEEMLDEFKYIGREEELGHLMIMLPGLMTLKEKAKELSELKEDDMIKEDAVHENCWKKLTFVLLDFVKRGWV